MYKRQHSKLCGAEPTLSQLAEELGESVENITLAIQAAQPAVSLSLIHISLTLSIKLCITAKPRPERSSGLPVVKRGSMDKVKVSSQPGKRCV